MALVAGIDSSTQSCKVVIRDAGTGALVREGRAPHPDGTETDPRAWWQALCRAVAAAGGLDGVAAVSVAAQQHGMVCLDERGEVVRPALLWNDVRSAGAAEDLIAELGRGDAAAGRAAWARAVGSVPAASFTVTKVRWLATHEPEHAARTAAVCLPHDWLTWKLAGAGAAPLLTDRSDASGTGYWSPATGEYRTDLLAAALGHEAVLPRVLGPADPAGQLASTAARELAGAGAGDRGAGEPAGGGAGRAAAAGGGPVAAGAGALLGPGAGDNAGAALALGAATGDVVVSIGTSGVACAVSAGGTTDASGTVAGFADATGRFLPLVCTLNAARVLDAVAGMLRVDHDEFARLALAAPPGAGGLVLVPYFEGERTPNRPHATGSLHGLRLATADPEHLARAAVEGLLCGMADAVDAIVAEGVAVHRVLLVGGGARSAAVRRLAPVVLGRPVLVPEPGEYVADGAARQAAWVLSGAEDPPAWSRSGDELFEADPVPAIRERYRDVAGE